MKLYFPGTIIERNGQNAEAFLFGVFAITKGLMLAQVREITGLDTPAIQNWVNRGWVQKPVEKRYGVDHLARIIIINMLRDVMKLETIASLLTYINGEAGNEQDNVVSEAKLYTYLCTVLDQADYETLLSEGEFLQVVSAAISDYREPFPGARERLINGMEIILTYYASAIVKKRADQLCEAVLQKPPLLKEETPGGGPALEKEEENDAGLVE